MKIRWLLLCAAFALPAQAGTLDNPGVIKVMCDDYADTAAHAAMARDKGAEYAVIKAITERTERIGASGSHSMTAQDKAFWFQYISGAVDYAYLTMPGTPPQQIHDAALTRCLGEFGR